MLKHLVGLVAMIFAYVAILVLSIRTLAHVNGPEALRIALTLAPMVPGVGICWMIWREIRRIDEFQRKLQFEALAMAFVGTALVTFSYGFLENVGYAKLSMFAVWPLMAGFWTIGLIVANLRYR